MQVPEEKYSYAVITEKNQTPSMYYTTYSEALKSAKFECGQSCDYIIVERCESFNVCGGSKLK